MTNDQDKINRLVERLDFLMKRQDDFSREINDLKVEIDKLQSTKNEGNLQGNPLTDPAFEIKKRKPRRER